jgi:diguanylate cyclase (GGDEF)-like protein
MSRPSSSPVPPYLDPAGLPVERDGPARDGAEGSEFPMAVCARPIVPSMVEVESLHADGFALGVLNSLPDATAVLDTSGTIIAVNHTWRMFGVDNGGQAATTGVGVNYLEMCARSLAAGCADAGVAADGLRAVLAGDTVQSEMEYPCPSPTAIRWFLVRATALAGPVPGVVVSHVNITRRKMAEEAAAHKAAHDPLTGLANRTLFTSRLSAALTPRSGRGPGADVGVLYLDLDGFKSINDTYGHDAGDEVLLTTAHRILAQVRAQDTVARLGGDEFAIVATRITADGLTSLAGRIAQVLAGSHLVHGHAVHVPASVGSYLAAAGDRVDAALRQADLSMYAHKRRRSGSTPRPGACANGFPERVPGSPA